MDKAMKHQETVKVYNNDWVDSLQNIVDRTESNLKGIGTSNETFYRPIPQTAPCCEEEVLVQRPSVNQQLYSNFKFSRRTQREKVSEIEQDILFQRFYQEVIKNFNTIDQKVFLDSQRSQRDILNIRNELEELK